ncbi:hypothetical protein SZ54_4265 [Rhizobium sp. UR51a]|nr:hypothetical protein SZ54_4265 [Rhizobium sp. UR51a]
MVAPDIELWRAKIKACGEKLAAFSFLAGLSISVCGKGGP